MPMLLQVTEESGCQHHGTAPLSQALREGGADTRGRTGDDGNLAKSRSISSAARGLLGLARKVLV